MLPGNERASIWLPDGVSTAEAMGRISHLAVGAHPDDVEFAAFHGIAACYGDKDYSFAAVIATDGAGSPRTGAYASCSDEEMVRVRAEEQEEAARIGEYGVLVQLGYPSSMWKSGSNAAPVNDLVHLFEATCPEVLYIHQPFDSHPTHVAVFHRCLEALRRLPMGRRPMKVYGMEVWRGLDWLPDKYRISLPCEGMDGLQEKLCRIFASQIAGGKCYDKAVLGRRHANATFTDPHAIDAVTGLNWALDLMPLVRDDSLTVQGFMEGVLAEFRRELAL